MKTRSLFLAFLLCSTLLLSACSVKTTSESSVSLDSLNATPTPTAPTTAEPQTTKTESTPMETVTELQMTDTVVGTGAEAVKGKRVTVHYTGTFMDGRKFDSSVDRGQPFTFQLGGGQVIQGWDEGFAGMKVGGKRTLLIPGSMAYGERGIPGAIPPNATLKFEVELLKVE